MPIRGAIRQAEFNEEAQGTHHTYTLQRMAETHIIEKTPLEEITFSNMDHYIIINGRIYNGFSREDVYKIKGVNLE